MGGAEEEEWRVLSKWRGESGREGGEGKEKKGTKEEEDTEEEEGAEPVFEESDLYLYIYNFSNCFARYIAKSKCLNSCARISRYRNLLTSFSFVYWKA